jgi:hypothetical protein
LIDTWHLVDEHEPVSEASAPAPASGQPARAERTPPKKEGRMARMFNKKKQQQLEKEKEQKRALLETLLSKEGLERTASQVRQQDTTLPIWPTRPITLSRRPAITWHNRPRRPQGKQAKGGGDAGLDVDGIQQLMVGANKLLLGGSYRAAKDAYGMS